jgi:hypothetical protein
MTTMPPETVLELLSTTYSVNKLTGEVIGPKGIVTPYEDENGYLWIRLYCRNMRKSISLAKLVWMSVTKTLVPKRFEVHHQDRDKSNNAFDNLVCLHQMDPKLIETAIKSGWAVPEEIKPELIQEMVAIVTDDTEEVSDKTKVAAFRALLTADQHQHERDNPQVKSKSGGTVNVSVQTNIAAVDVLRQALRQDTQTLLPSIQPPEIKDK